MTRPPSLDAPRRRVPHDIVGVVLAGGASSRMGIDKALLPLFPDFEEESGFRGTWLERAFVLLAERCEPTGIVGRIAEAGSEALPSIETPVHSCLDKRKSSGPLGGLETALELAEGRAVLALPCDLPLLSAQAIDLLLAGRDRDLGATAFRRENGRPEPAVVILEARALKPLTAYLDGGNRKVETFLEQLGARWLLLPEALEAGFANLNTPADRRRYESGVALAERPGARLGETE